MTEKQKPAPPGWVRIHHPDLENSSTLVTERAFRDVHAPKGWVVDGETPDSSGESETTADEPTSDLDSDEDPSIPSSQSESREKE